MTADATSNAFAPDPLGSTTVEAPDASWQQVRDRAISGLRDGPWSDHNPSDPGITMLEGAALSLADLHYRTAARTFDDGPVTSRMYASDIHWSKIDLPVDAGRLAAVAAVIADHRATVDQHLAGAASRSEAVAALFGDGSLGLDYPSAAAVVRVLRSSLVRVAALDLAGAVDGALDAVDGSEPDALALLKYDPGFAGLWDDEIVDLFRLRRRRQLVERLADLQARVAAVVDSDTDSTDAAQLAALETELTSEGLTAEEALAVVAGADRPAVAPEHFESDTGDTLVWPPTAIQARAVEPVTIADHVRLALAVDGVRRAWVLPGQRPGTGWDGRPITAGASIPGAVTILVEAGEGHDVAELELAVLRGLAAPGETAEVDDPHGLFRDDPSRSAPRRMLGDQIGVATLSHCPIEVKAALHVEVGTVDDRATVIAGALARVADLLEHGRPESQPAPIEDGDEIDGPWPPPEPAPPGWIPGEPIRVNEVIQRLADDPLVLGVSDVGLRRPGQAWYHPPANRPAEFPVPDDCVPRLADQDCVTVDFVLREDLG